MAEVINKSGRRKEAVARVYLTPGAGQITINKKSFEDYFPMEWHRAKIMAALSLVEMDGKFDIKATIRGGGVSGQCEAMRLAVSKALVENDAESKPALRHAGFMTRDSRVVERKKYGKVKARKKTQFSKR